MATAQRRRARSVNSSEAWVLLRMLFRHSQTSTRRECSNCRRGLFFEEFWSAPAERSGDGALDDLNSHAGIANNIEPKINPKRSRRFALPAHSKTIDSP